MYSCDYASPLGKIMLACDDKGLTGLRFSDSEQTASTHPILDEARRWLDVYFSGKVPDFTPPLNLKGTDFQLRVWNFLLTLPYGHTTTYGKIASLLSCKSAQAIGKAVGRNPVAIIVPCHRVIAVDGGLVGYSAGLWRKEALLRLEGHRQK